MKNVKRHIKSGDLVYLKNFPHTLGIVIRIASLQDYVCQVYWSDGKMGWSIEEDLVKVIETR